MIRVGEDRNGGVRLYRRPGDRRRAAALLAKRGWRCCIGFAESEHPTHRLGLAFVRAAWAGLLPYVRLDQEVPF